MLVEIVDFFEDEDPTKVNLKMGPEVDLEVDLQLSLKYNFHKN